jgi:hypothetical protein
MKRDLLNFVPRPTNLLRRLKALAVGSALTSVGLFGVSPASATPTDPVQSTLAPTIVDRSKKTAKLVLRLPGRIGSYMMQHRSHSSHSSHASHASHASHYSGSSGVVAPPAPPRPAAPAPVVAPPVPLTAIAQADATENIMSGLRFDSFDRVNRVVKVKDAVGTVTEFVWRDDTKVGSAVSSYRMDEYLESHFNNHPWQSGQQLTIMWKPSADGKKRVATSIR